MPSKYKLNDHGTPHFITFAVVEWVDALSRPGYKEVIIESLLYCQQAKGLILYSYVIMNNHVHLIAAAEEGSNLPGILTSKVLLNAITSNVRESRRDWMMWISRSAGKRNSNNKNYQFWQQDNRPIQLSTNEMMDQRLEYVHNNPVKEGIVYSSAINYADGKGMLEIEFLEWLIGSYKLP